MNDETPKRKRWRWIIAGVLLLAVVAVRWWYWTRGDARFVGKWLALNATGGGGIISLDRDRGTASEVTARGNTYDASIPLNGLIFGAMGSVAGIVISAMAQAIISPDRQ